MVYRIYSRGCFSIEPEAEFLNEIQTKVWRVFLLVTSQSPHTALPWHFHFFKLTQLLTVFLKEKGEKPDKNPYPLPLWLKKAMQKRHVWKLSRLCPETSIKLSVHSWIRLRYGTQFKHLGVIELIKSRGLLSYTTTYTCALHCWIRKKLDMLLFGRAYSVS